MKSNTDLKRFNTEIDVQMKNSSTFKPTLFLQERNSLTTKASRKLEVIEGPDGLTPVDFDPSTDSKDEPLEVNDSCCKCSIL